MKALLVVDIDHKDGWSPEEISRDSVKQEIASAIQEILTQERMNGGMVAFVIYGNENSGQKSQFEVIAPIKQQPREDLESETSCLVCNPYSHDRLADFLEHRHDDARFEPAFIKGNINAFTNRAIAPFFKSKGVSEIVLVGCYTDCCVLETAKGAVREGFAVTLIEKCSYFPFGGEWEKTKWIRDVQAAAPFANAQVQII